MNKKWILPVLCMLTLGPSLWAIPTEINYQGTLREKGAPANGPKTITFQLVSQDGKTPYSNVITTQTTVVNGLFSTTLDFQLLPTLTWESITPYIQVSVAGQTLSPTEKVSATAYANVSNTVADGAITQAKLHPSLQNSVAFPGVIVAYAGVNLPAGWLLCDGSAVNRTSYAALFAAIGTTWGQGDGVNTFNIPDLRGRTPMGSGQGTGLSNRTVGQALGEETHQLTIAEIPSHSHSTIDPGHSHGLRRDLTAGSDLHSISVPQGVGNTYPLSNPITDTQVTGITIGYTGGGAAHNNIQPSSVVNFVIKY